MVRLARVPLALPRSIVRSAPRGANLSMNRRIRPAVVKSRRWRRAAAAGIAAATALLSGHAAASGSTSHPGAVHAAAARVPIPVWQVVGQGPASPGGVLCPQIRIAPSGVPHLAYQDFHAPAHRLGLRRYAGGAWIPLTSQGSGSTGEAWYNRLAFAPDGSLLVAMRDYGLAGALGIRRCAQADAPWETLGGGPASPSEAHYTDIALLQDGRIAAVFQDRGSVPVDRTSVVVSGAGSFETISGAGLGGGYCAYQSLAVRSDGALLAGFTDGLLGGRASVYAWRGGTSGWQALGEPGFTPDIPNNLTLRIGPDGTAYVAYYVWNSRIVVRRFDGLGWPAVGPAVDGADTPTVETEGWRQWLGFEIDAAGRPVVAYQAANLDRRAVVKRWDPGLAEWRTLGEPGFTPGPADYLSLDLAPDGTPYVAFRDGATSRAIVMALR